MARTTELKREMTVIAEESLDQERKLLSILKQDVRIQCQDVERNADTILSGNVAQSSKKLQTIAATLRNCQTFDKKMRTFGKNLQDDLVELRSGEKNLSKVQTEDWLTDHETIILAFSSTVGAHLKLASTAAEWLAQDMSKGKESDKATRITWNQKVKELGLMLDGIIGNIVQLLNKQYEFNQTLKIMQI